MFSIIPFKRRIHDAGIVVIWTLFSTSMNSYCSDDPTKTDSKHIYGGGLGMGTPKEPQEVKT